MTSSELFWKVDDQALDREGAPKERPLGRVKNPSFTNRKLLVSRPEFSDGNKTIRCR